MPIDELSELIGVRLPETESETLGGFVQQQLGHIPEVGERVSTDVVTIEVEEVEGRRVRALCVRMNDHESPGSTNPVGAV
jgi:putative hemolysin